MVRLNNMKEINLQVQSSLKIEGASLDPNHGGPIQIHFDEIVTCRENAGKFIWATSSIEQKLDEIIKSHLFDQRTDKTDFSKKIKKALTVLKESNRLSEKEYSKLKTLLSDIRKKRNACAHGKIFKSTERGIVLEYYDGGRKSDVLSDEYWTQLGKWIQEANEIINEI
jgi:hypothetical protein